ncbi:MAG: hypothetical protein PHG16_06560 [Lachnospiraceae bacterium]|nr:hypothetical protein [Lachnospiraceae bacterium]
MEEVSQIEEIYQIYDRVFKRIFNLSSTAIINLINGLFEMNYPLDSSIFFSNKEFVGRKLNRRFADVIVVINGDAYHLEAQMCEDSAIVLRVFEYGFLHAMENRGDEEDLVFPEPVVIYLDTEKEIPKTSPLLLRFGNQGTFEFTIRNLVYQDEDLVELNRRKMVVLIPFQLIKLKKLVKKGITKETLKALQNLVEGDILGSIKANLQVGNITKDDAEQLMELTGLLYQHICGHYKELKGAEEMKPLLDGAMELPLDKYRIKIDQLEAEKAEVEAEKAEVEAEKAEVEAAKAKLEEENRNLRERIKKLEK